MTNLIPNTARLPVHDIFQFVLQTVCPGVTWQYGSCCQKRKVFRPASKGRVVAHISSKIVCPWSKEF